MSSCACEVLQLRLTPKNSVSMICDSILVAGSHPISKHISSGGHEFGHDEKL